jgi:SAM-dependent methyltransferase
MTSAGAAQKVYDERQLAVSVARSAPHAALLTLPDCLPFLTSPDSGLALQFDRDAQRMRDPDGLSYPLRGPLPVLVPARLQAHFTDCLRLSPDNASDAFMQYFLLACIKQSGAFGDINAPVGDVHYQRHLFRMREFLRPASGRVLDVGCDDPLVGQALLPESAMYLGLDPFCRRGEPFRIVGFAEYLPFANASFQAVVFNTSLDHILDWRRAIDEALRVLVPGGDLFISTLVWESAAGLVTDAVHFHHFRDYEIFGALGGLEVTQQHRYDYKGNQHRHGLYVAVRKPSPSPSSSSSSSST